MSEGKRPRLTGICVRGDELYAASAQLSQNINTVLSCSNYFEIQTYSWSSSTSFDMNFF